MTRDIISTYLKWVYLTQPRVVSVPAVGIAPCCATAPVAPWQAPVTTLPGRPGNRQVTVLCTVDTVETVRRYSVDNLLHPSLQKSCVVKMSIKSIWGSRKYLWLTGQLVTSQLGCPSAGSSLGQAEPQQRHAVQRTVAELPAWRSRAKPCRVRANCSGS